MVRAREQEPNPKYCTTAYIAGSLFILIAVVLIPLTCVVLYRAQKSASLTYNKHQLYLIMTYSISILLTGVMWCFPAAYLH